MFHATTSQLLRPLLVALTITTLFTACKPGETGAIGPAGPAGPTGAAGPAGPTGATGNANVIQISYGSRTHTGAEINYDLTGINASQVTSSAFFTYVTTANNVWYALPGATSGGAKEYRAAVNSTTLKLYVNRIAGTGSETFSATRILFIPANDIRNGRKAAVDYSSYEAVKAYYNLPD